MNEEEKIFASVEEEKKYWWQKVAEFFKSIKKLLHGDLPAVWENKITSIQKQMQELEEQDAITVDCLRDVAGTLQTITGVLEGGKVTNANMETITEHIETMQERLERMKAEGAKAFTVSTSTLSEALKQAYNVDIDSLYVKDENNVSTLSPNVEILVDRHEDGREPEMYLRIKTDDLKVGDTFKVDIVKHEDGREKVRLQKAHVTLNASKQPTLYKDGRNVLQTFNFDKTHSLEQALAEAKLENSEKFLEKRMNKGKSIRQELLNIFGTKEDPEKYGDFICASDKGHYYIKDRTNNTMLTLTYDAKQQAYRGLFSTDVDDNFESKGKPSEVMRIEYTDAGIPRYFFVTSPAADKLLDTDMATRLTEIIGIKPEDFRKFRKPNLEKAGGEHVEGEGNLKVDALRAEIAKRFAYTNGMSEFAVHYDNPRKQEGQLSLVTPDKSRMIVNFDKDGNMKKVLWKKEGSKKSIPVVKCGQHGKNNVQVVLGNKITLEQEDFCACYSILRDSIKELANLEKEERITYGKNVNLDAGKETMQDVTAKANAKIWADLAAAAITANGVQGQLGDKQLVDLIMEEHEQRYGKYPSAEYREKVTASLSSIYWELARAGVTDDIFGKNIDGNTHLNNVDKVIEVYGIADNEEKPAESKAYSDAEQNKASEIGGNTLDNEERKETKEILQEDNGSDVPSYADISDEDYEYMNNQFPDDGVGRMTPEEYKQFVAEYENEDDADYRRADEKNMHLTPLGSSLIGQEMPDKQKNVKTTKGTEYGD